MLVSEPQLGDTRTQLSLEGPQTPPTARSGWKRMKTQILLERAVGWRRLLESFAREAGSARRSRGIAELRQLHHCCFGGRAFRARVREFAHRVVLLRRVSRVVQRGHGHGSQERSQRAVEGGCGNCSGGHDDRGFERRGFWTTTRPRTTTWGSFACSRIS